MHAFDNTILHRDFWRYMQVSLPHDPPHPLLLSLPLAGQVTNSLQNNLPVSRASHGMEVPYDAGRKVG